MKELRTEIEIQASPETVWQILMDFDHYPEWNPFFYRAVGNAAVGQTVKISFKFGTRDTTLTCRVLDLEPNRLIRWKWQIFFSWLYSGQDHFSIEPLDDTRVRFVQHEEFRGLLLPLFAKGIDTDSRRGFEEMLKALKTRAESSD